jgi:hypothetical protein
MNGIARNFLETYARGGEVDGGWKFAKALQQTQLDFSAASLGRLDQLLGAIRGRANPTAEELQGTVQGRNFCSLLAYYLIEVVIRRTGAESAWHDRDSALRALPAEAQLPDAPYARLVVLFPDQGTAFMPLGWIEAQILGVAKPELCRDYVEDLVQQLERDGPAVWWAGMHAVGRIASWQMMMAADGGAVMPTMLGSTAPTAWRVLMTGLPGTDVNEALQSGGRSLEENPEGATWQVLAYDGFVDIDGRRCDAVIVILHTYGKSPLRLKLAFPYRPAARGREFEILQPSLRDANVENDKIAMLVGSMERGIQSIKWAFGKSWDQLRRS